MKKKLLFVLFTFLTIYTKAQVIQVTDEQLFNAFKQDIVSFESKWKRFGGGGNCASIALIKAAIGTFGINGVFKNVSVDSVNKLVHVRLKNDKNVDLTFDRLTDGKN